MIRAMHHPPAPAFRIACDSLVALGGATRDGRVHFAKNSDRPELEAQPLLQSPRRRHTAGSALRCTYIEIPQVDETAALIGSRPWWCWGFEHGLNEHGVAIGNHTIFTRDQPAGKGLIGMDLVRLGLERGRSAREALEVITTLLGAWGQGGSGFADKDWSYNNSFLIADRRTAFVLETSDRGWAWREVSGVASLSNHMTLGTDWQEMSPDLVTHAVEHGWWPANDARRFDVAAAYRDTSLVPESISSGRHGRTCALLDQGRGGIDVAALQTALRDHYGALAPSRDISKLLPEDISVCMHAEPVGTTTASMVAALPVGDDEPLVYRASLGSPCCSVFVPLRLDAAVPESMTNGGADASPDSLWWQCKRLVQWVQQDWETRLPLLRAKLDVIEAEAAAGMNEAIADGDPARATSVSSAATEALARVAAAL
jgi:dipeptidase